MELTDMWILIYTLKKINLKRFKSANQKTNIKILRRPGMEKKYEDI